MRHAGPIHLLVSDVLMPGMNGRDLWRRLIDRHPDLKVLFMSGFTADVIAQHGVPDDGVRFLHQRFSGADLAAAVRQSLDAGRVVRAPRARQRSPGCCQAAAGLRAHDAGTRGRPWTSATAEAAEESVCMGNVLT